MSDEITVVELKKWFKSKTFWMGVLIILGGVIQYLMGVPEGASIGTICIGIASVVMRFLTKTPIK